MQTEAIAWMPRRTMRPVIRAFFVSLVLHALLFGSIELVNRYDLWRFSPLVLLAQALGVDVESTLAARRASAPPAAEDPALREADQEIPVLFVDVDPSQATTETPAKTEYYSSVSSLAGNRDTSRDTDTPALDGTQDKVLKTMDSERALVAQPLEPAPVAPQQPQDGIVPEAIQPQAVTVAPAPSQPFVPPVTEPDPAPPPGETLLAKANPVPVAPAVTVPVPTPVEPVRAARPRPRTVAAALAQRQLNPNSALVGEKMKQEGGVRRFSVSSSLDVQATPLGSYDAKFIAAVQQCWYGLLEQQGYSLDRMGKVVIDFRLTPDGRITDLKAVQSDVGEIYTMICELAIHKPAPYEEWPTDVRRMVGAAYRDVRFTFYY
ncbi:MAG TPA: hypothetical protein P5534_22925 [Candidatus Paceibacterota bacterium]|nr:hypothetical protein [Candidatus Paceibacterota bacterium]